MTSTDLFWMMHPDQEDQRLDYATLLWRKFQVIQLRPVGPSVCTRLYNVMCAVQCLLNLETYAFQIELEISCELVWSWDDFSTFDTNTLLSKSLSNEKGCLQTFIKCEDQLQKSHVCSRAWRAKFLGAQQLTKKEKAMHFFYLYDNPDFRCLYSPSIGM